MTDTTATVQISLEDLRRLLAAVAYADATAGYYSHPAFMNPAGTEEIFLARMEVLANQQSTYTALVRRPEINAAAPAERNISISELCELLESHSWVLVPTENGEGFVPFYVGDGQASPSVSEAHSSWDVIGGKQGLRIDWDYKYQPNGKVVFTPRVWNPQISNILQHEGLRWFIVQWLGLVPVEVQLPAYDPSK